MIKKRRQYFKVKYRFNYPSGKVWTDKKEVLAYSEVGASDVVKWMFKSKDITILSVEPKFKYAGKKIYPNNEVIGDR